MDARDRENLISRSSYYQVVETKRGPVIQVELDWLDALDVELFDADGNLIPACLQVAELTPVERDGEIHAVELPARYEVCDLCDGKGRHVNPSIDAHGITAGEWQDEWSEEDRENYMTGLYDVDCYRCEGRRVTATLDESRANKIHKEIWNSINRAMGESRREAAYQERYGF